MEPGAKRRGWLLCPLTYPDAPGVREEIALGERVARVDQHLGHARDPGAAANRGNNRRPVADARLVDDPALEGRTDRGRMGHRVARLHQPARMEDGQARGEAGARGRAVEPAGRDDDGVPGHLADAAPGLGDLDDADAGDRGILRMGALELLARRGTDRLAGER